MEAFQVVLTEADENEVHPWEEVECECEDYHDRLTSIHHKTPEEHRCRHIREAIMFHHFAQRVEPVEAKQESLSAFTATADD
ncbi:hypothetical protein [Natrinema sp. 74]|uniref:hypothetical protein n=1 Tax=Natrinema sp. 74 TaxID=3384159 RepID=UPI0038D375B3